MPTERITIVVEERGTRIVNRRLNRTADAASVASKSIQLLRRALVLFASAVLIRRLLQVVDAFTQLSNRLRIVTSSFGELRSVTEEVLAISNRTRTAFDANAEVFTRVALSARELGASQGDILQFLESLNQSIIISGASAQEASAGIIQLTQGIASNRLSGDELRSVLEQLPRAATVIADSLQVGRGELRELGQEGRITGEIILNAFKEAREELADEFTQVLPTIGQSFTVLRNQIIATIGDVNRLIPIADTLTATVLLLANSLRGLAFSAVIAGVIALALNFNIAIARASDLIRVMDILTLRTLGRLRKSLAANNASMQQAIALSIRYERVGLLPLTAAFARLRASVVATNAVLNANILSAAGISTVYAGAVAAVTKLAGGFVLLRGAVASASAALLANPFVLIASALVLVLALLINFRESIRINTGGLATLGDLATSAFGNIQESLQNINEFIEDIFGFAFPSLQGLLDFAGTVIREILLFVGVLYDNSIGLGIALYDGIVATFSRLPAVVGDLFIRTINSLIGGAEDFVNTLVSITSVIGETLRTPIQFLLDILVTGFNAVGTGIEVAINFVIRGINTVINNAVEGINLLIDGVNKVAESLGRSGLDRLSAPRVGAVEFEELGAVALRPGDLTIDQVTLDRVVNPFEGAGAEAAEAFSDAFAESLAGQTNGVDAVLALFQQAELAAQARLAAEREAELARQNALDLARDLSFQEQFDNVNTEIGLLRLTAEERDVQNRLAEIKNDLIEQSIDLEDEVNKSMVDQIESRLRQLQAVEAVSAALDEIRGVNLDLVAVQEELNDQVAENLITVEQAARAYVLLSDAVQDSNVTLQGERQKVIDSLNEEIDLLRVSGDIRGDRDQADQAAASLTETLRSAGIAMTEQQTQSISDQLLPLQQQLSLLEKIAETLDDVQGITIDLGSAQAELKGRVDDGTLSIQDAEAAYRKLHIASLETSRTFEDGFGRGILKLQEDIGDLASSAENVIVGAFRGMEDALVSFVTTGEINFAEFANSIIQDLVRIAVQQAIIGPLLGLLVPGGGFASGGAALAGARALGGPVTGGQPYLVGERGPELFVPPTGGGSIEPNVGQGGGNVRIINVVDPSAMQDFMASPEGERVILNTITRNPSAVRQAAGG